MGNVLFVTWDGGGNLPPALGIATQLTQRHHTIRFLGHEQQRSVIESAGLAFEPFTHARPWSAVAPHPGFKGAQDHLAVFTDRGMGDDLLAVARRWSPDLVAIDGLLFGALKAAQRADLTHAVLMHTLYSQQRAQWGGGLPALLLRLRGARPLELWSRAHQVLVTTLPEVDQYGDVPGRARQTGPVWQGGRPEPAAPPAGEPLVMASLSTLYQDGQMQALQAIVDALARLPVRGLVTSGPSVDPSALRPAPNVEIQRYVPHAEVLPRASLVICHGGHGTAMSALGHDLPLVIMPMFLLGDQPAIGRELERLGAARVLPKTAPPERIAAIARELLGEGPHRQAARTLGARIRQRDGADAAAETLEGMLALTPA